MWNIQRRNPTTCHSDLILNFVTLTYYLEKMSDELTKKFYRISDVSELLNLPQSTIRFWEKEFSELRPRRSGGGTRYYTPNDIEILKIIKFLIKDKRLTIEGAREHLRRNRADMERKHLVVERLQSIRSRLTDLLDALDQRQRELRK